MEFRVQYIRLKYAIVLIIILILALFQQSCLSDSKSTKIKITENNDLYDVLLLYNPKETKSSDINFSKLSEYYGLKCKEIDIANTQLIEEIFLDANGNYYKAIYISAYNIENNDLLSNEEILLLKNIVKNYGVKLLICDVAVDDKQREHINLKKLINNKTISILNIPNPCYSWSFSDDLPFVTKEFTNQKLQSSNQLQSNYIMETNESSNNIKTILSQMDEQNVEYPIFIEYEDGSGEIFIESGTITPSLEEEQMYTLYNIDNLSILVPMMMFIRYSLNDECWHNDYNYANLTIDDPSLSNSFSESLSYYDLLDKMKSSDFHTTIGFCAKDWNDSQKEIIELFLQNPDLFSLVIHGNNHDGYEFYKYSVQEGDEFEARPIDDQESDIIFAVFQLELHKIITGIPFGRIMIFPYGISPEDTLVLLKKYNYNATINGQDVPLDSIRGTEYDYNMYQAIMNYANFPVIQRRPLSRGGLFLSLFNAFIDKPILYYTHVGEDFSDRINLVEQINEYKFPIEWQSLGFIMKHLYLEKLNDDNSVDIKMYGNNLIISNETSVKGMYHIKKEEKLNVPIKSVEIDGGIYDYQIVDDTLCIDIEIPAKSAIELKITYGPKSLIGSMKKGFLVIKCITRELIGKLNKKIVEHLNK